MQKSNGANSKNVNWPEDKRAAIIGRMISEGKVVLGEGGERRGKEMKGKERKGKRGLQGKEQVCMIFREDAEQSSVVRN